MSSYYEKLLATGEVKCIDEEVPDPYGKGLEEYNKCFEQLYSLVAKVIDVITSPRQEEE